MCMFCKCDTVKESTTTHVVNYKNSIIVIKKFLVKNVSSVEKSITQMKLLSSWKKWLT